MPKKRKRTSKPAGSEATEKDLAAQIKKASEGLWYISETDAEILPFDGGPAPEVTRETLLGELGRPAGTEIEERSFSEFFDRLTALQDWFGDEEKNTAQRYAALRELLERQLRDLKVFKVGKIQLDVYVVGLDKMGNLAGLRTKAVET